MIFITGKMLRPIESYLSWCQITADLNASTISIIVDYFSALIVILICQAYIQCHTGFNLSFATVFKHIFAAILLAIVLAIGIPLIFYESYNIFNIIPAMFCLLTLLSIFINVGFMIKEHEQTFPIIVDLVTKPSSVILPEGQELQMYPSWLEMYPVHE